MVFIEAFGDSTLLLSCAFIYGLAFGSFLNVCIYRLPRGLSVVRPASACPACRIPIKFYDNIPVLSWLLLRGRCRACKAPISPRYLIVELLIGGLFVLNFAIFGLSPHAFKFCVFSFLVIGLIFTDADLKLLPDRMTLPGLAAGVAFSLIAPPESTFARLLDGVDLPFSPDVTWRLFGLFEASMGAIIGAGSIWLIGEAYKRVRGVEGMGFGDVKLMAMVGSFLGAKLTLLTLMMASIAGALAGGVALLLVWRKRLRRRRSAGDRAPTARGRAWASAQLIMRHFEIPFGVFLGTAALISGYFGGRVVDWYLGLF